MDKSGWRLIVPALLLVGLSVWLVDRYSKDSVPVDRGMQSPQAGEPAPGEGGATGRTTLEQPSPSSSDRKAWPRASAAQPGSRLATMRDAENAPSAVARAQALERLAEIEPALAARKLLELAQFCGAASLDAREQLGDPSWLLERRRAWCSGLDLSDEAMQERLRELTRVDPDLEGEEARIERLARRPYMGRRLELEERIARAREEDRSDRFTRLVRRAVDFEELATLAAMNQQHAEENGGRPLWQLGVELQQQAYPQAKLLEAQWAAIMLYGCRQLGGCGPGQYITMTACTVGWYGRCAAGSSLEEQIYLTTPPATYNLALEIVMKL